MGDQELCINWVSEWDNDVTYWVPAQMLRSFQIGENKAKLCCRWRHQNPWSFFILGGNEFLGDNCIFLGEGLSKTARFEDVRKRGVSLLFQYLEKNSDG